jgi:hypothetical protein
MTYDRFENGKKFKEKCQLSNFLCFKCGSQLYQINKDKGYIFGFYCLKCDVKSLSLIEWIIGYSKKKKKRINKKEKEINKTKSWRKLL